MIDRHYSFRWPVELCSLWQFCRSVGCCGAAGGAGPQDHRGGLRDLDSARADYEVVVYEGVQRSFTNSAADSVGQNFDMPLAYDQEADRASWEAMKSFFDEIFSN